ncbi:hypothetical protein [Paenibacillus sp. NEAU-GSW1]|uniref:hypothetical protein n=1 Tax=Paenibacillus sp. NEAU-GSW1 TaxID=2682486 RepID=UPI001563D811|nr:hypothetical protein [Paenibacillus sp. NEAU-GSW1]
MGIKLSCSFIRARKRAAGEITLWHSVILHNRGENGRLVGNKAVLQLYSGAKAGGW